MERYTPPRYLLGLDLGKKRDWTALAVLRQTSVPTGRLAPAAVGFDLRQGTQVGRVPVTEHRYDLVHLERWRDRSYRAVVPEVQRVQRQLHRAAHREAFEATGIGQAVTPRQALLVDQTGVGIAVVDDLRGAGLDCHGVTIHGGDAVTKAGRDYRVPKRELVGQLQVLLQAHRLGIPDPDQPGMEIYQTLIAEMDNFRAKTTLSGHDVYGAGEEWREHHHDDLVLAVAMAVWYGEYAAGRTPRLRQPTGALRTYLNTQ